MRYKLILLIVIIIFVIVSKIIANDVTEEKKPFIAGIRIYTNLNLELLLTDSKGRRIGFDKITGRILTGIDSYYGLDDCFGNSKMLDLYDPDNDLYTLEVIGTESKVYYVDIDASDVKGNCIAVTYRGIIEKGDIHKIEIWYSSIPTYKTTIKRQMDISLFNKEIITASKYFITNKALTKSLTKIAKVIKQQIEKKEYKKVKENLSTIIEQLSKEQDKLAKKEPKEKTKIIPAYGPNGKVDEIASVEEELPEYTKWMTEIDSVKILINDAKLLLEELK